MRLPPNSFICSKGIREFKEFREFKDSIGQTLNSLISLNTKKIRRGSHDCRLIKHFPIKTRQKINHTGHRLLAPVVIETENVGEKTQYYTNSN